MHAYQVNGGSNDTQFAFEHWVEASTVWALQIHELDDRQVAGLLQFSDLRWQGVGGVESVV